MRGMKASERLSRLQDYWTAGAWALVLLGASCAAAGCVALVLAAAVALALQAGEAQMLLWWEISAAAWLPVGVGLVLPALGKFSRRVDSHETQGVMR